MTTVPLGGGGVVVPGDGLVCVWREHAALTSRPTDHIHVYIVSSMIAFTISLSFALRAFIAFLRDTFDC